MDTMSLQVRRIQSLKQIKMEDKYKNDLEFVRKRTGLTQKQISTLIGFKRTTQISHYENGLATPNLETAFKLQTIFKCPLRSLFRELHEHHSNQIEREIQKLKLNKHLPKENTDGFHYCTISLMLKRKNLPRENLKQADAHVIKLINSRRENTEVEGIR